MGPNQERRNEKIRDLIKELKAEGYKVKQAIVIAADRFYLTPETIRDIWYRKW